MLCSPTSLSVETGSVGSVDSVTPAPSPGPGQTEQPQQELLVVIDK